MAHIKDFKEGYYKALDALPVGATLMRIITNENNMPVDLVLEYVNANFAKLYGMEKNQMTGKHFGEIFAEEPQRYLYTVWNTACNGIKQETAFYDNNAKRHLLCKYYQAEYGLCGCLVTDNSVNNKLTQMVSELQKSKKNEKNTENSP